VTKPGLSTRIRSEPVGQEVRWESRVEERLRLLEKKARPVESAGRERGMTGQARKKRFFNARQKKEWCAGVPPVPIRHTG